MINSSATQMIVGVIIWGAALDEIAGDLLDNLLAVIAGDWDADLRMPCGVMDWGGAFPCDGLGSSADDFLETDIGCDTGLLAKLELTWVLMALVDGVKGVFCISCKFTNCI